MVKTEATALRSTQGIQLEKHVDIISSDGKAVQLGLSAPAYFLFAKHGYLYALSTMRQENESPVISVYRLLQERSAP